MRKCRGLGRSGGHLVSAMDGVAGTEVLSGAQPIRRCQSVAARHSTAIPIVASWLSHSRLRGDDVRSEPFVWCGSRFARAPSRRHITCTTLSNHSSPVRPSPILSELEAGDGTLHLKPSRASHRSSHELQQRVSGFHSYVPL